MTRWRSVSTLRGLKTTPVSGDSFVANTKSAEKAARRAETNRNRKADASAALKDAQPVIDSLVNKNVIHRNKAARHKSALSARIKAMPASK